MLIKTINSQRGFTLVELLFAMALFSAMMVMVSGGVVTLYQRYQSGGEVRNTQQSARFIAEKVSRDARAATLITAANNNTAICLFKDQNTSDPNQTLTGVKYYRNNIQSDPVVDKTTPHDLMAGDISVSAAASADATITLNNARVACTNATPANAQKVSTSDTSIQVFNTQDNGGKLASVLLGVASNIGLSDIESVSTTTGVQCPGQTIQQRYCSATNLQFSAGPL